MSQKKRIQISSSTWCKIHLFTAIIGIFILFLLPYFIHTKEINVCKIKDFKEGDYISVYGKIISEKNFNEIKKYAIDEICFEVTEDVYAKLAYRAGTEGIVAIVKEKKKRLEDINLQVKCDEKGNYQPLILVVESVEKPGNLGALLRTADACGADGVLICDELTDLYNPNLIRASLGGIFTQNVICCTNEEAYKWLKENNIVIYTAQLQDSKLYYNTDMRRGCAIVMGNEAKGLTDFWRKAASEKIMIPMLGKLDSLNVSVSAAILCYEALRQRSSDINKNK